MEAQHTPGLETLVRSGQFVAARALLEKDDSDLSRVNTHQESPLHILCDVTFDLESADERERDVIALAGEMLSRRPSLATQVHNRGATPLLICFSWRLNDHDERVFRRSNGLTLYLLRSNPEALRLSLRNELGQWTPFQCACETNANIVVMREMLSVDPSLASTPCVAFDGRARDLSLLLKTPVTMLVNTNVPDNALVNTLQFLLNDQRVKMILKTALHGELVEDSSIELMVHAMCSYQLPLLAHVFGNPSLLAMFQPQLSQRDGRGNLPIHYAVRNPLLKEHGEGHSETAINDAKAYWAEMVRLIVAINPEMALVRDRMGRLPLNLALECTGVAWSGEMIVKLANACPRALYRRGGSIMLYPALIAATRAHESNEHFSVSYELFRETPQLFSQAWLGANG